MEDRLNMSNREIDRLKVIHSVMKKQLTWEQAGVQLDLSKRHIGRLTARVKAEGNKGIIHRLRGKPSNHQLLSGVLDKSMNLIKTKYVDFGPTFANEKLLELHKIKISTSSLRTGMIEADIWKAHSPGPKHRQWRQRRSCVGELIQLDGSDHDWFEGRAPKCALLIFIDDATSRILHAEFVTVENSFNLLTATKQYLMKHGRPVALYVDKDSIYKINRQASVEEQLRDEEALSQFSRAMGELGIEMIFAHSPQAKGRVERTFNTQQDRLVKELRLAGISDIETGNKFLARTYVAKHNDRFAVTPERTFNAHRPLLASPKLEEILSFQTERILANDFTLRFQNQFMQILPGQKVRLRPKNKIMIQIRLNGAIHLKFKDRYLNYKSLPQRPVKPLYPRQSKLVKISSIGFKPVPYVPAKNHPWRNPGITYEQL